MTHLSYRELILNMAYADLHRRCATRLPEDLAKTLNLRCARDPDQTCPLCRSSDTRTIDFADPQLIYAERWHTCKRCEHCFRGNHATTAP